jgi:hypothetical protein
MTLHSYAVGTPYSPTRTRWPEAIEYNYRSGAHELRMFLTGLTEADIAAVARGPMRVAVFVDQPVIMLITRFEGVTDYSDSPYTIHMVPEDERTPPSDVEVDQRQLLQIILVAAETGIIRALRVVALNETLSRRLHEAIRTQLATPFDQEAYDRKLAAISRRGSSKQLYSQATARMQLTGREQEGRR